MEHKCLQLGDKTPPAYRKVIEAHSFSQFWVRMAALVSMETWAVREG